MSTDMVLDEYILMYYINICKAWSNRTRRHVLEGEFKGEYGKTPGNMNGVRNLVTSLEKLDVAIAVENRKLTINIIL